MKKTLFIALLFALFTGNIFPQTSTGFGFKLGATIPNYSAQGNPDPKIETTNHFGFTGGLFLDIALYKKLNVESELCYNSRASGVNVTYSPLFGYITEGSADIFISYLSYSLTAKYYIVNALLSPYVIAGPSLNLFLGYGISDTALSKSVEVIESDNLKKISIGLCGGIGCEFKKILPFTLLAEVRFTPDLNKIFEDTQNQISARAYALDFRIGCKF